MFPKHYFGGAYFGQRYWPQSEGNIPDTSAIIPDFPGVEFVVPNGKFIFTVSGANT